MRQFNPPLSDENQADDPFKKSFTGLMIGYTGAASIGMQATLKAFPLKLKTVEYTPRV